ncbi:hypothetical protein IC006_0986 [Sulfuracidifex tepidarius]|uniref:Uncharacterized protein n=1 Tax=Sulfuracidifex tepidarius TaxID=1294262 RepID=A0A510E314_9CREN|nr:hypothetical protein IC006_0986 [Sulfuracidifex tepidarius]BBG26448.1 hypothetical protein IC007_0958 [Sulfuracidifex tepidarius]
MISLSDYELISIKPGTLTIKIDNEELKVRVFSIPIHVIKNGENYSVQVNVTISVDTKAQIRRAMHPAKHSVTQRCGT